MDITCNKFYILLNPKISHFLSGNTGRELEPKINNNFGSATLHFTMNKKKCSGSHRIPIFSRSWSVNKQKDTSTYRNSSTVSAKRGRLCISTQSNIKHRSGSQNQCCGAGASTFWSESRLVWSFGSGSWFQLHLWWTEEILNFLRLFQHWLKPNFKKILTKNWFFLVMKVGCY